MGRDMERANLATAEITEDNNLLFEGALFTRNAVAEVGAKLNPKLPGGDDRFAGCEALTLRVKGEGHTYAAVLVTSDGSRYVARFPSRLRYSTVRLPFSLFRAEKEGQPPLDPEAVVRIGLRWVFVVEGGFRGDGRCGVRGRQGGLQGGHVELSLPLSPLFRPPPPPARAQVRAAARAAAGDGGGPRRGGDRGGGGGAAAAEPVQAGGGLDQGAAG
jgi:hypothetical protein